ncbi:MAG TPA: glycosyltransferase family 2 protein [Streptosporangiaceae bacterium]|nr:glycosyltransferase family 2 protein [Streptosporangiaceae bacterium]
MVSDAREARHFAEKDLGGGGSGLREPASDPRVTVIIPACGAGEAIVGVLDRLFESVTLSCEVLVVADGPHDPTLEVAMDYAERESRVGCLVNRYNGGSANSIRSGMEAANAEVIVVTMPDGQDDLRQIDDLARLVERGCAVAAASRYMHGGQVAGAPRMRGIMSRGACRSLQIFTRLGTSDATNSFKACSAAFAKRAGIDSQYGFDIGIELAAKARRLRLPIAEIPTIGVDHLSELSALKVARWIPGYLRWYCFCFGPRLTLAEVRAKASASGAACSLAGALPPPLAPVLESGSSN